MWPWGQLGLVTMTSNQVLIFFTLSCSYFCVVIVKVKEASRDWSTLSICRKSDARISSPGLQAPFHVVFQHTKFKKLGPVLQSLQSRIRQIKWGLKGTCWMEVPESTGLMSRSWVMDLAEATWIQEGWPESKCSDSRHHLDKWGPLIILV